MISKSFGNWQITLCVFGKSQVQPIAVSAYCRFPPPTQPTHCQHCQNIANIAIATMHSCHHCQHCSQYAANVAITVTIVTTASNIHIANIITNFVILCLWAMCKRRVCGISKCASVSLHLFVAYFPCQ